MAKNNLAKRQKTDSSAESVFVYTGPGCFVPKDVVRVQFDASVVEVSIHAFFNCIKLREVVLNDGLQASEDCEGCILLLHFIATHHTTFNNYRGWQICISQLPESERGCAK